MGHPQHPGGSLLVDGQQRLSTLQIILPVVGIDAIRVREPRVVPALGRKTWYCWPSVSRARNWVLTRAAKRIDVELTGVAGVDCVADWHGVGRADSTVRAYESCRAQH